MAFAGSDPRARGASCFFPNEMLLEDHNQGMEATGFPGGLSLAPRAQRYTVSVQEVPQTGYSLSLLIDLLFKITHVYMRVGIV